MLNSMATNTQLLECTQKSGLTISDKMERKQTHNASLNDYCSQVIFNSGGKSADADYHVITAT